MGTNYYAQVQQPDNTVTELHIGKSSAGWAFSLRIHPEEHGITDLADWMPVLFDPTTEIVDEYGMTHTAESMFRTITGRAREDKLQLSDRAAQENGAWIDTRYRLLRKNFNTGWNARRGHNGSGTWDCCNYEFS